MIDDRWLDANLTTPRPTQRLRRLRDVVARQADGVRTDHYTMSIGLDALERHGSSREAQCILALLDSSGSEICPEEVLRYTVVEVFI